MILQDIFMQWLEFLLWIREFSQQNLSQNACCLSWFSLPSIHWRTSKAK